MKDNIKKYDLKLKQIFTMLIISGIFVIFALYMLFMVSNEERYNMFITELKFSAHHQISAFGSVYICGLFAIPISITYLNIKSFYTKR